MHMHSTSHGNEMRKSQRVNLDLRYKHWALRTVDTGYMDTGRWICRSLGQELGSVDLFGQSVSS